jgi:hypothetical protein
MAIDMFSTRTMIAALRQMLPARTFLRDTFFRNVKTFTTPNVDIDIVKGKRRTAVYVSPIDEGHVSERLPWSTNTYQPPYIKEKRPIKPIDLLDRYPGDTIYADTTPTERLQRLIADNLSDLMDMITRAEEQQAASALFTGSLTFRDANDTLTFPIRATHQITGMTNLWSSAAGTPLTDVRTWRRLIIKDCGLTPDILVGGSAAVDAFLANPQIANSTGGISQVKIDRGEITPQNMAGGVTYWGFLPDISCDVYSYDEFYYDPVSQTDVALVPANKILLGCTGARMDRLYGVIQDLEALYAVDRFPKSWMENDPSIRWMMLQSAPLLVPHQVDSFLTATVC